MLTIRNVAIPVLVAILLAGCAKKPETGTAGRSQTPQDQTPAAGTQPGTRKMTRMSVAEARNKAPFKVLEPTYLPEGATYLETRYIQFDDKVFVVLQYEFKDKQMYFQVDEYLPTFPENELPGTQNVQVGEHKGQAAFQHGLSIVRWTQDGTRLMLNGALNEKEALKVASSFN